MSPSVFSYLVTAAAVRESTAAEATAKPALSSSLRSLWGDRVDAGVRPATFMARVRGS
jgi:hypothetical protein